MQRKLVIDYTRTQANQKSLQGFASFLKLTSLQGQSIRGFAHGSSMGHNNGAEDLSGVQALGTSCFA